MYGFKLFSIRKNLKTIFTGIRVVKAFASFIELEIDLNIQNTSSKTLEIDGIKGDLFINGAKAGFLTLKTPVLIKSGNNPIKLGVQIKNKEIIKVLFNLALSRATPEMELRYKIQLPFFAIPQKVFIPKGSISKLKLI